MDLPERLALPEEISHVLHKLISDAAKLSSPIDKYNAFNELAINSENILAKLMLKMTKRQANGFAWDYFYKAPYCWNGHSSELNLKTRLEIYYEEDGNEYPEGTILHYRDDGTIYGTSTDKDKDGIELGEQPIYYYGSFEIDNFNFELCFDRLKEGRILFVPVSFNYKL